MTEPTATSCASCGWSTCRKCVVCSHHVCRCECIHGARLTAVAEPTPIPPEYITTGCGPGLRVKGTIVHQSAWRGAYRARETADRELYGQYVDDRALFARRLLEVLDGLK